VRVFTERGLRAAAEAVGTTPDRAATTRPSGGEPVTTRDALEATEQHDYFSGEETVGGVMDELEDKPGGPDGGER
jgi:hypothetical protein